MERARIFIKQRTLGTGDCLVAQTRFNANDVRKNVEAFPTSLRFRTIKRINKHVRKLGQYLRLHRSSNRKRRSSCLPLATRRAPKIGNESIQRLRGFERNLSVRARCSLIEESAIEISTLSW